MLGTQAAGLEAALASSHCSCPCHFLSASSQLLWHPLASLPSWASLTDTAHQVPWPLFQSKIPRLFMNLRHFPLDIPRGWCSRTLYCFVPSNLGSSELNVANKLNVSEQPGHSGWRARPVGIHSGAGPEPQWWHQQFCLFFSPWHLLSRLDSCPKEPRCFLPGQLAQQHSTSEQHRLGKRKTGF